MTTDSVFAAKLKEICTNQPGIVVFVGPDGEELVLMDSALADTVKKNMLSEVRRVMLDGFEHLFDNAIDEWRHQHAKAKTDRS